MLTREFLANTMKLEEELDRLRFQAQAASRAEREEAAG